MRNLIKITCPDCGKEREVFPCRLRDHGFTGRCRRCADAKLHGRVYPRGPLSHAWKHGRRMRKYAFIYSPGHHRADKRGYVREHIVVWEAAHSMRLPIGWVIHHYNGDKKDNRPENLYAMPKSMHGALPHLHTLRIRELEQRVQQLEARVVKLEVEQVLSVELKQ